MLKCWSLLLSVVCLGLIGNLNGQQVSSSYTIKAQALVVDQTEIEMVTIQNLQIDDSMARDGIIHVSAQHDPEAGLLKILGKSGAHFRVQFNPEWVIENTLGDGTLLINYELFGFQSNLQFASEPIDPAKRVMVISNLGEYYFWIGGRIDISNAHPGSYQGEFTIEIEYL